MFIQNGHKLSNEANKILFYRKCCFFFFILLPQSLMLNILRWSETKSDGKIKMGIAKEKKNEYKQNRLICLRRKKRNGRKKERKKKRTILKKKEELSLF